ncbi:MAG: hypothetical protein NZX77_11585 [Polyangiaceae bacterium]|nr:hypothetical protein [Polyangiaceae bacterium]
MAIELDDKEFPLLRVRFSSNWTQQDFDGYLARYLAQLQKRQPFAAVFDATQSRAPSATERRQQAEFLREHEALLRRYCTGVAFVIASPTIRGALTAIFWIQPPFFEYVVVSSVAEGTAWARQRLALRQQIAIR